MKVKITLLSLFLSISSLFSDSWPKEVQDIQYKSEIDQSMQPAMMYVAKQKNRPLLVALHTWSHNYKQSGGAVYAKWCIENDWNLIHPNFRGMNKQPQALGSEYVVVDIESAYEYMIKTYSIDTNKVYLTGVSGGGHASLLMAGRKPQIWAGVSAWCGISDIAQWWKEKREVGPERYADHIEAACGNPKNESFFSECKKRSPLTYLKAATQVPLDINHGLHDGRKGSVPFTHSIYAFNEVVGEKDKISNTVTAKYYDSLIAPNSDESLKDSLYGSKPPVYRKQAGVARLTIFDGGHEMIHLAALNWLSKQEKGKPVVWDIKQPISFKTAKDDSKSGL